jgi:hypothetical protein
MTTDKRTFAERREALATVAATLRDAVTIITAEVDAMCAAEARFAERANTRRRSDKRHG